MAWQPVLAADELWSGEMAGVEVDRAAVLLIRVGDRVVAFEDACAHQRRRLSGGTLDRGVLVCPAHHWEYDATSGCGLNPRGARLKRFPVKVDNGWILVDVNADAEAERDAG